MARHRFQQMRQLPNEPVDAFHNRLQQAVQSCDYKNIPISKAEDLMLLLALILIIRDNTTRESLLTAEDNLCFDCKGVLSIGV